MNGGAGLRRGAGHAAALVAFLILSLALTWPLAASFTTHVPGDGIDDPALAWNLWWIKVRLVDQLQPDIFHAGWLFYPIQVNLGFYTLTPLNGLLSIPLQSGLSLVIANNLLLLSSFVLSGYGVFLLTRAVWAEQLAACHPSVAWAIAVVAGSFAAFASAKLFYAGLGQFNIASSQWIPFAMLSLWRTLHAADYRAAVRRGALAGIFLTFQAWAELTYASFLLILVALLYLWWCGWLLLQRARRDRSLAWRRGTLGLLAAGLLFALGIAPFLAAMLPDLRAEGDFFASGGGFADIFSADLMGFLVPTRRHPWWGAWTAALPFANDKGQHIYLGYTIMGLALAGTWLGLRHTAARVRRATGFWLAAAVLFWLLCLGPQVRWAGHELPIPGPFALVSRLPFFSGNRYPSRYSVMLLPVVALLAAQGLLRLTAWLRRPRMAVSVAGVALLLFVGEHLSVPLPLSDFRVPSVYARIAADPGDFAVLELPTGWRNGARVLGRSDVLIMMQEWYQTAHGKRHLGGNTSRNPAYKFQYFTDAPVLGDLIALMNADREHLTPVLTADYAALTARLRRDAPALLDFLHVRYVLLYVDRSPAMLVRAVEDALPVTQVEEWQGDDWEGKPATIRLYAVADLPDAPAAYRMGDPAATHLLAEGWSPVGDANFGRAATRAAPALLLDLPPTGAQVILTFAEEAAVRYTLDGRDLGAQTGRRHVLTMPPGAAGAPLDRLTLTIMDAPRPVAGFAAAASPIAATGTQLDPGVTLAVESAGEEVGDFAHISVNGVDVAPNTRGYNLVSLTPGGAVLDAAAFDTLTPGESARLAAWLAQWPTGTVIAGAVADEASFSLGDDAVAALRAVGVAGDLRSKFRWSHAFVGVVGAPPGTALEETSLIRPARVWLGAPVTTPHVYARLLTVETVPAP